MPSASVLACCKELARHKLSMAFAESASAGRMAAEFSLSPHSGTILKGGIVCYDLCVKEDVLKVDAALIRKYTPESAEVTEQLCVNLKKLIPADIHVAVTGLTTPGGSEEATKPVGTIFLHILYGDDSMGLREVFTGSPEEIILQAIDRLAELLTLMVKKKK